MKDEKISFENYSNYSYKIAHNLLNDSDADPCIANAKNAIYHNNNLSEIHMNLQLARITRQMAITGYTEHSHTFSAILEELEKCIGNSPKDNFTENVVALQVSDIIDKFARELTEQQCNIFIRRYFFGDSLSDIASIYHINEKDISKILMVCRQKLITYLRDKEYKVSSDTLLAAFTDISDDLICNNRPNIIIGHRWRKPVAILAAILLVTAIGIGITIWLTPEKKAPDPLMIDALKMMDKDSLDVAKLLDYAVDAESNVTTEFTIYLESYTLQYTQLGMKNSDILKYCKGEHITDYTIDLSYSSSLNPAEDNTITVSFYKLLGHNDILYIIQQFDEMYYLCEFNYMTPMEDDSFPYNDVLTLVYDVHSAEDLAELIITDTADDPIYGNVEVTDEIGMLNYIDNETTLRFIYTLLSQMECYGPYNWREITSVDKLRHSAILESYNMAVKLKSGITIDCLHFYKGYQCFYDSQYGIAYSKWDDTTVDAISSLFYIDEIGGAYVPDFNIHAHSSDVSGTGITIHLKQSGDYHINNLYTDSTYGIERWNENASEWQWVDYVITEEYDPFYDYTRYSIPYDEPLVLDIDWSNTYGQLPSGSYRIYVTAYISEDDSQIMIDGCTYFFEFDIP